MRCFIFILRGHVDFLTFFILYFWLQKSIIGILSGKVGKWGQKIVLERSNNKSFWRSRKSKEASLNWFGITFLTINHCLLSIYLLLNKFGNMIHCTTTAPFPIIIWWSLVSVHCWYKRPKVHIHGFTLWRTVTSSPESWPKNGKFLQMSS